MAVVIAQTANPAAAGTGTTITYSAQSTGTAAHDRVVVLLVSTEASAGAISSATIDYGAGALAMNASANGATGAVGARAFWLHAPTGTTATFAITFAASQTATSQKIAVYSATGAQGTAASSNGIGDTDADPISSGAITIPANGGCIAVCTMAATGARTWTGITEGIDESVSTAFQFTTGTSTTSGTPTITVSGANNEDGALAWVIFNPSSSVERLPAAANLALSGTAPTAEKTLNVALLPAATNLSLSSTAPALFRETFMSPATANLALSVTAPSAVVDVRRDPASVNLLLSTAAPTLFRETFITPATANLALSTIAPDRVTDVRRDPANANLALSTTVPAVDVTTTSDTNLSPATSNLVLSTTAPSLVVNVRRDPASVNLTLSTAAPTLFRETFISPAAVNLSLSTAAPSVLVDFRRDPAPRDLLLSTTAPALAQTTSASVSPATANLVLTTTAPTVASAATGEYIPAQANLVLSTAAPTVVTDFRFTPATANLTLSTVAPSRVTDARRDPASANLSLTTTAPTVAQTASVNVSPDAAHLLLSASAPSVVQTGLSVFAEGNPWRLRWQLLRAQQEQARDRLVAGALIEIEVSLLPGSATGASRAASAGVESIVGLVAGVADAEAPAGGRALRSKIQIRAGIADGEARFVPAAKLDRRFELLPGFVAAHKSVGGASVAIDFHLRH